MSTYLLYNSILIGCFFNSYLAEKLDSKSARLFFRFIVFLLLIIPASLRYYTGTDYGGYVRMFYNEYSLQNKEVLWRLLNYLVHFFSLPVQYIFVFSSILIYYPICFKLQRKHFCLSIVLYIILMYYFKSYNGLRQMISVSFVLWALIKFEAKQYIKAMVLFILAIGFHKSSIIVFPCFIISFIRIKGERMPFIFLLFLVLFCIKFNCLQLILSFLTLIGSRFSRYANSKYFTNKTELGTGIGVFSRLLFSLLAVFYYKKVSIKTPEKKYLLNFSIIYIITYILAAQFIILGRLRDVFIFVPLLVTGYALEASGKYKKLIALLLLLVNLFLFEIDIKKQNRYTFSNEIYPYYSIFYKGDIK